MDNETNERALDDKGIFVMNNSGVVSVSENSEETTEEPDINNRIDAIEESVAQQGKQINSISEEQEKTVDILEKVSNMVMDIKENMHQATDAIAEEPVEAKNSVVSEDSESEDKDDEVEDEEQKASETEETSEEVVENAVESEESEEEDSKDDEEDTEADDSEEKTEDEPAEEEVQENTNVKENTMTDAEKQALIDDIKNQILDAQVKAPEVVETEDNSTEEASEVAKNWRTRYNDQVNAAWESLRLHSAEASVKLNAINKYNAELKAKAANDAGEGPITIDTLDGFILPPEVDRMIHGKRTNYSPLLNAIEYVQTDNLNFMWATRVGDIDMQNVALCDDGKDGNLKPIETYELKKGVAKMEEMAAVTPICDNATRYMAVDILQDIASGYRTDYDRKLAQLFIVRMQQAINTSGNAVEFNPSDSVEALVDFIKATTLVSDGVTNGTFVFNARTKAALQTYLFRAAAEGQIGHDTFTTGEFPTIFGFPYIVVPNDLMPTLGKNDIKTFKALNNETGALESVDITSPVFYGDIAEYRGKTSGTLKYDVSADAMYELPDGSKHSAWQRNEIVMRGSFLRGGYIADPTVIAGLTPASS